MTPSIWELYDTCGTCGAATGEPCVYTIDCVGGKKGENRQVPHAGRKVKS